MNDMSILHHLMLHFFMNFGGLVLHTQTNWFIPKFVIEDVLPEVLRCEGLHKRKYGVVDAWEKQHKDPACQGSYPFPMYHNTRLDDTKDHHLHQPWCKVSRRCYNVPPPFLSCYLGLVGEAEWDVPLVVLVHLQKYHHKTHELHQVKSHAGGECRNAEYLLRWVCSRQRLYLVSVEN